jgi:hypothetical protein
MQIKGVNQIVSPQGHSTGGPQLVYENPCLYIGTLEWRAAVIPIATSTLLNVLHRLQILEQLQGLKHCQVPLTPFVLSRKSFGKVSNAAITKHQLLQLSKTFIPLPRSQCKLYAVSILHSECLQSTCKQTRRRYNHELKAYSQPDDYAVMPTICLQVRR